MTFPNTNMPKRQLPFLGRNWNQSASFMAVGAGALPANGSGANHAERPSKRPRLHLAGDCGLGSANGFSRGQVLNPIPNPNPLGVGLNLGPGLGSTQRSLRVNVLKIVSTAVESRVKRSVCMNGLDTPSEPLEKLKNFSASCKVTILDNSPLCEGVPVVMYCTRVPCTIKTFKNPLGSGTIAKVELEREFHITEDALQVNREDGTLGLPDKYRLDVEFSAARGSEWPPFDLAEHNIQPDRRLSLFATMPDLFMTSRKLVKAFISKYSGPALIPIGYSVEIDAAWSTGFQAPAPSGPTGVEAMPEITVCGETPSRDTAFNGVNGVGNGMENDTRGPEAVMNGEVHGEGLEVSSRDMSEEMDGETTPNRSLRTRHKAVYNLKVLSDKAQGRVREKNGNGKSSKQDDDGQVSYLFPTDQVSLDSFRCVACGASHESLRILQAHLKTTHSNYSYNLLSTKPGPRQFRVTHRFDSYPSPTEEFQFTRPAKGFNLDRFVKAKASSHDGHPVPPSAPARASQHKPEKGSVKNRKILVPHTKHPLYDPVSRARLEPGTELVPPKAYDAWWVQKHRDTVLDYTDIGLKEREYLVAWDAFALPRRISSPVYFAPVFLDFVREKAFWLLETDDRPLELLKHISHLLLVDVLSQSVMDEAAAILAEARAEKERGGTAKGKETDKAASDAWSPRTVDCAICDQAAIGAICVLKCSGETCARHFHLACIQGDLKMSPTEENWLCNECVPQPSGEPAAHPTDL